jgi:hypothetical protein
VCNDVNPGSLVGNRVNGGQRMKQERGEHPVSPKSGHGIKSSSTLPIAIEDGCGPSPFEIEAWLLLTNHLPCIPALPTGDAAFSARWTMIQRAMFPPRRDDYPHADWMNVSRHKHCTRRSGSA